MRIVNFGSLNIDYVYRVDEFLRPGETKPARSREIFCGGKGLNQSIACARAGLSTFHAGFLGYEGMFLKEKLAESGVSTDFIREVKQTCGHAIIQVSDSGQNCILLYPGTNALLTEAFADEVLSHFSSGDVALFQNETNLVPVLIEKASRKGLKVALNAKVRAVARHQYKITVPNHVYRARPPLSTGSAPGTQQTSRLLTSQLAQLASLPQAPHKMKLRCRALAQIVLPLTFRS